MINLLPSQYKNRDKIYSVIYGWVTVMIIAVAIVVLGAVALTSYDVILASNISDKQASLDSLKAKSTKANSVAEKAGQVQSRVEQVENSIKRTDYASLLSVAEATIPSGSVLKNIKIGEVKALEIAATITATTISRQDIILHKDKLLSDKTHIKAVSITSISESGEGTKTYTYALSITYNVIK